MQYASTSAAVVGSGRIFLLAASNSHHLMGAHAYIYGKGQADGIGGDKNIDTEDIFDTDEADEDEINRDKHYDQSDSDTYRSLCVCMYVCIYIDIDMHMCVCTYIHTYIYDPAKPS